MSAPVPRWAEEFVHPALFYRGTAEYLRGTVPFIREGLAAGEPVALAVPGPNLRLILTELGADADRVRLLDMNRAGRNPGRLIPNVLRAFVDAYPSGRVRIIGEHRWTGHTAREYPVCAQQESLINLALAGRPVTLLCPYDADRVGPQTLAEAQACHPRLIDASGEWASAGFAPERVVAAEGQPCSPTLGSPTLGSPTLGSPTLGSSAVGSQAVGAGFTFDAAKAALAGQFACDHAQRLGLGGDHAELKLIVSELVTRVVPGAQTGTLRLWAERGYLVCDVRHSGGVTGSLPERPLADPRRVEGRALLLVHHLSDLVLQRSGPQGTTTRVYLKLPTADGPPKDRDEQGGAPRTPPVPPVGPTPLPWQTYEALHAAERFERYLPQEATVGSQLPTTASTGPVLEALAAVEALARVVDRWRVRLVRLARTRGVSWTDIGQSLGVSKQAAHERYGRVCNRPASGPDVAGHGGPQPPVAGGT